jgi:hypothetical protein
MQTSQEKKKKKKIDFLVLFCVFHPVKGKEIKSFGISMGK